MTCIVTPWPGRRPGLTSLHRAKLLAEFLAFVQVADQCVGQKRLRVAVAGELELIVAA